MAITRSSQGSQPNTPEKNSPGQKRKATDQSPAAKKGAKQQKTLEETAPDDSEMKEAAAQVEDEKEMREEDEKMNGDDAKTEGDKAETNGDKTEANTEAAAKEKTNEKSGEEGEEAPKEAEKSAPSEEKEEPSKATENGEGAIEESSQRAKIMPSNVLEKGIFYFFARGRVGIDDPQSVQDFARSYIVMRPLPQDAKLTEGALEDLKNNRLLAVPKKVMPISHRDAFMSFVEKGQTSIQDLKDNVLSGSEYSTKTTGVRHTPAPTPLVEGVYAITQTNRTSHFAYAVTIPEDLSEVQKDMGWAKKGSFVMSLKNPDQDSPANAALPQGPAYSDEMLKSFNGLRWSAVEPKFIDYDNAQILLIGEGRDEIGKAGEATARDQKHDKESPEEEVLKLEDEDSHRTGQLNGEDSVFADLGLSAEEYPKLKSTW